QHAVDSVEGPIDGRVVAEVAGDELDPGPQDARRPVRVPHQGPHRRAAIDDGPGRVGTDPAGGPEEQDRHRAAPVVAMRRPSAANSGRTSGRSTTPRLTARSRGTPWMSRLTGTSSRLPVRVWGTAGTSRIASGTCRGAQ